MNWGSTTWDGLPMRFAGSSGDAAPASSSSPEVPAETSATAPPSIPAQLPLVTYALVAACVAVFAAMALAHVSPTHPAAQPLLRWGANYGPLTLGGQWWRLLTSVFLIKALGGGWERPARLAGR